MFVAEPEVAVIVAVPFALAVTSPADETVAIVVSDDAHVTVDLYERLPAPFGLVRNGVAPDHPKLKQAIGVYHKIAQREGFEPDGK